MDVWVGSLTRFGFAFDIITYTAVDESLLDSETVPDHQLTISYGSDRYPSHPCTWASISHHAYVRSTRAHLEVGRDTLKFPLLMLAAFTDGVDVTDSGSLQLSRGYIGARTDSDPGRSSTVSSPLMGSTSCFCQLHHFLRNIFHRVFVPPF